MKLLLSSFILLLLFTFTSKGQTTCDSVTIHSLEFDPLGGDSFLKVVVSNQSSFLFSYPLFVLEDANGDTVAAESINFFGLGQYRQGLTLTAKMEDIPTIVPDATLSLSGHEIDTLVCYFEDDYSLCPEVCAVMSVWIQGYGTPTYYHEFSYTIKDENGAIVYDDSLRIDSTHSWKSDSICLAPGSYEIDFTQDTAAEEQLVKCFIQSGWGIRGKEMSNDSTNLTWAFDVLQPCLDTIPPLVIDEAIPLELDIVQSHDQLKVYSSFGQLDALTISDIHGRQLYQEKPNADRSVITTSEFSRGIYVLTVKVGSQRVSEKFVIR